MKNQQTRRDFLQLTAAAAVILGTDSEFVTQNSESVPRITTLAGTGVEGMAMEGDLADQAKLNNPFGIVIGPDGALWWVEYGSHRLLRLDLKTKRISVVAGTGVKGYSGDGG